MPLTVRELKEKTSLQELELTNGEGALVAELFDFLQFIVSSGFTLPRHPRFNTQSETLLARYIQHHRREQMQYISDLRVSRGQSPLPPEVLK